MIKGPCDKHFSKKLNLMAHQHDFGNFELNTEITEETHRGSGVCTSAKWSGFTEMLTSLG